MSEQKDNLDLYKRVRWDGRARSHYEVWYTTLSQLNSGAGFWIRYSLLVPRRGESCVEVWFTSYVPDITGANLAVAQKYPIDQFASSDIPFSVRMGPSHLESARMTGMLDAGGVPVTWDLVYEPVTDPLVNLPDVFYKTWWPRSKFLTPHPFMVIGGKIQIADHTFILNSDPGQQGHVWGSRHAEEWIWFHCSSFVKEGGDPVPGYLGGVAGRQKLPFGLLLPPVSFGHLVWNEVHVPIRPATGWEQRWEGPWEWKGRAGDDEIRVTLSVPWKEMVLARYRDPAGHFVFCHHTDRADCSVRFRAPRRPPRLFQSTGTAYLEIGSRSADPRAGRRMRYQS